MSSLKVGIMQKGLKGLRATEGNTQNHGYIYDRYETM